MKKLHTEPKDTNINQEKFAISHVTNRLSYSVSITGTLKIIIILSVLSFIKNIKADGGKGWILGHGGNYRVP